MHLNTSPFLLTIPHVGRLWHLGQTIPLYGSDASAKRQANASEVLATRMKSADPLNPRDEVDGASAARSGRGRGRNGPHRGGGSRRGGRGNGNATNHHDEPNDNTSEPMTLHHRHNNSFYQRLGNSS